MRQWFTEHGVGRYHGLMSLEVDQQKQEFLHLEYANQAKLYVPVASLHLISRYSASDQKQAPLHKLGTDKWSASKRKAAEKIRDTAAELLALYAKRQAHSGFALALVMNSIVSFLKVLVLKRHRIKPPLSTV